VRALRLRSQSGRLQGSWRRADPRERVRHLRSHQVRRIAVFGCGGAGKTTLARALGDRLGLPVVHGDLHRAEWERFQRTVLARDAWVIDAMRLGSLDERLAAADTAIFIDRGALACLLGILRRRLCYRGGMHVEAGVADFISWEFVRWVVSFRHEYRPRVLELLAQYEDSTEIIVLRSRREIDCLVRSVGAVTPAPAGARRAGAELRSAMTR
jgi:adenylate kinase family enzyme